MARSKLLLGDLTELVNKIIQYFQKDFSTLHSCILVNRLWCRIAIPLLWEDPFSTPTKNYHFIEVCLHNLNKDDKATLNGYGINSEIFPSNASFNYPGFIKRLNTYRIGYSIEKWVADVRILTTEERRLGKYLVPNTNLKLKSKTPRSNFENSARLIYRSLLQTFIENEVNLHTFEVVSTVDIMDYEFSFELILQNLNFVHNIKNLKINRRNNVNPSKFLTLLSSNCNSISTLYLEFAEHIDESTKNYSQIINSQQDLKKIIFNHGSSLLFPSLKDSNCSNTLKIIIFYKINFQNIFNFNEVYQQLNVLESIHILYCRSLNSEFIQQINKITNPFKLKSFFMGEKFQIESFRSLLEKSGDHLENIELLVSNNLKQQILESIIKYCKKIKIFNLPGFNNQNIYLALDLIKYVGQNLNYLTIEFKLNRNQSVNEMIEVSSIILQELGQILPFKLEYLNLSLMVDNTSDFEIFLKNSQNVFIKKLLIRCEGDGDILPYIKKYIMKKKRSKYLALRIGIESKCRELFFFEDEVKEFELHNIRVQNYFDLYICGYKLIEEIYLGYA